MMQQPYGLRMERASSQHYTDDANEDEPTTMPSPSLERHEWLLKTLAGLAQAVDRMESKLELVLLPEKPRSTPSEGGVVSRDEEPASSPLGDQHAHVQAIVQAQTRRLEYLTERIDL